MFQQLFLDFNDRVAEVNLYFQVLTAFENSEIAVIPGTGTQLVPTGEPPNDWTTMLKGASYLVVYNLVEAFVRKGFQVVFDTISGDAVCATDVIESIRSQWVMQKNRRVKTFNGSPEVYMKIALEVLSEVIDRAPVRLHRDRLPVSGNLDADSIRELCRLHGVEPAVSPQARGGAELTNVMVKRNSLSHGTESFVEVGRAVTLADITRAKDEAILFVHDILRNMEAFVQNKAYRMPTVQQGA